MSNPTDPPVRKGSPFAAPSIGNSPSAGTVAGAGPQTSGPQHSGPQHSGPQHSGPQTSSASVAATNPASPFHVDAVLANDTLDPEWGVLRASIWASAWVAIFAIACYQMFPGGGVLVAALGCGLAIVGLFSSRPAPASVLLVAHAGLFFACYQRLF